MNRVENAVRREGVGYVIRQAGRHVHKNYLRHHLPRHEIRMNGMRARSARLLDDVVPWKIGHPNPETYEAAIVESLKEHLREGDQVVIVGGGWGVTSSIAASIVGETGSVKTFEASSEYSGYVEETAELNGVRDRIEVTTAVVSRSVAVRGNCESKDVIQASDLPDCDVLELDCEGAETEILDDLHINPRIIIVEGHGHLGSPSNEVIERLQANSYEVLDKQLAERGGYEKMCRENDIYVITARRTCTKST